MLQSGFLENDTSGNPVVLATGPLQPSVTATLLCLRFDQVHRLLEPIRPLIVYVLPKDLDGYTVQPFYRPFPDFIRLVADTRFYLSSDFHTS